MSKEHYCCRCRELPRGNLVSNELCKNKYLMTYICFRGDVQVIFVSVFVPRCEANERVNMLLVELKEDKRRAADMS
jgi:hypothetical protein